jgi:hypothetical protein
LASTRMKSPLTSSDPISESLSFGFQLILAIKSTHKGVELKITLTDRFGDSQLNDCSHSNSLKNVLEFVVNESRSWRV